MSIPEWAQKLFDLAHPPVYDKYIESHQHYSGRGYRVPEWKNHGELRVKLKDLRVEAKNRGLKGRSKMRKLDLIHALAVLE